MSDLNELATALAAAQGEIMPAPKDAANPYFKSKYASLPAIREAIRDVFARHGLSVIQIPAVAEGQLRLHTLLLHCSGQSLDCGCLAADVDLSNPQKIGSAITYFRRYALAAISQTVADEDDDANAASGPPRQQTQAPLSDRDRAYVTDALNQISQAKTSGDLVELGTMFKAKSPAIQNALRDAYKARYQQLREEQEHGQAEATQADE